MADTVDEKKLPEYDGDGLRERNSSERKGSVVNAEVIQAELFDERYERTQRGDFSSRESSKSWF
jgi:hypothetical protein